MIHACEVDACTAHPARKLWPWGCRPQVPRRCAVPYSVQCSTRSYVCASRASRAPPLHAIGCGGEKTCCALPAEERARPRPSLCHAPLALPCTHGLLQRLQNDAAKGPGQLPCVPQNAEGLGMGSGGPVSGPRFKMDRLQQQRDKGRERKSDLTAVANAGRLDTRRVLLSCDDDNTTEQRAKPQREMASSMGAWHQPAPVRAAAAGPAWSSRNAGPWWGHTATARQEAEAGALCGCAARAAAFGPDRRLRTPPTPSH